jgi:RNA polymerase sigma-70 factor (ECF subfamily)
MKDMDDLQIARALRERRPEALAALTEKYGQVLIRTAHLQLGDAEDARDAAQQCLVDAWNAAGRLRDASKLRSWLLGILINRCRRMRRSWVRRLRRRRAAWELRRGSAGLSDADVARLERLAKALEQLSAEHREVIVLRYYRQMGVDAAAEALGIPPGTVKSRTRAAIGRLRGLMEQDTEE